MKSSPLVICALLGAAQAVAKHQYIDDREKYTDDGIKALMEKNTKNLVSEEDAAKSGSTAAFVTVNKPNLIPNLSAQLKDVQVAAQKEEPKQVVAKVAKPQEAKNGESNNQLPQPPQALSESELTAENLAKKDMETDMSNNISDNEYVQLVSQESLFALFINNIQSPEDLGYVQMQLGKKGWHGRKITDLDGDGIEDNVKLDHDQLDEFYDPLVFGVAEDIHNTRHGNLPGHTQMWFTDRLTEPTDHRQDIVHKNWETK